MKIHPRISAGSAGEKNKKNSPCRKRIIAMMHKYQSQMVLTEPIVGMNGQLNGAIQVLFQDFNFENLDLLK